MDSATDRVNKGILWLDSSPHVPKNWRNLINVDDLRFADADRGPIGQIFGGYYKGLHKMKMVGNGETLGYRTGHKIFGDSGELKKAWAKALRTDKVWTPISNYMGHVRHVKGIKYLIFTHVSQGGYKVVEFKSGQTNEFPNLYKNLDSAKRFVRKIAH